MTDKPFILAVIPARGGSKGIPGKNMIPLCGAPLIDYTLNAALGSSLINDIMVTSDDDGILKHALAKGCGMTVKRPEDLASDTAAMLPVIIHAVREYERDHRRPDIIILLQPTSPLRTSFHIDKALSVFMEKHADSLVSVVKTPHNFTPVSLMRMEDGWLKPYADQKEYATRQDKPLLYGRNGPAILISSYDNLITEKRLYGDRTAAFEMAPDESIDIDTPLDLEIAGFLLKRQSGKDAS